MWAISSANHKYPPPSSPVHGRPRSAISAKNMIQLTAGRFVEDALVCEYGCWALTVFACGGNAEPEDFPFQEAAVEAGALRAVGVAVDAHPESSALRR